MGSLRRGGRVPGDRLAGGLRRHRAAVGGGGSAGAALQPALLAAAAETGGEGGGGSRRPCQERSPPARPPRAPPALPPVLSLCLTSPHNSTPPHTLPPAAAACRPGSSRWPLIPFRPFPCRGTAASVGPSRAGGIPPRSAAPPTFPAMLGSAAAFRRPTPPGSPSPGSETRSKEGESSGGSNPLAPGPAMPATLPPPRLPEEDVPLRALSALEAIGEPRAPPRGGGGGRVGHGPPAPQEEPAGGREGGRPGRLFPLFSLRWSRSDPQYLEKVFEDVQEGGREGEFSAEKLNLPYSSGRVWDLSLLTAPQGTDMIFRTTLQLPKIPSSLPGCLPGCTARLLQKGEIGRAPSSRTSRAGREAAPPSPPPPPPPQLLGAHRRGEGDGTPCRCKGRTCKRGRREIAENDFNE